MASLRISIWLVALLFCACSGNNEGGGSDASVKDAGGRDIDPDKEPERPRFDSGQVLGDAVMPCDPFEPDECAAGEECDVVLRRNPTADDFDIYTGCVRIRHERGLGDPCVPWNDFSTPYAVAGLFDEVHSDPCEQGLLCVSDPDVRGLFSCQESCQSGRYMGFPRYGCGSAAQYCAGADPYREVCIASDGCDPVDREACGPGRSCYLRTTDLGEGVLSVCLPEPPAEEAVENGAPCQFFNDCQGGSVCWGPVRVPPTAWTADNVACRPVCSLDGSTLSADAGASSVDDDDDDDGGVEEQRDGAVSDGDGCPGVAECVPFDESGLTLGTIDGAFGQCE